MTDLNFSGYEHTLEFMADDIFDMDWTREFPDCVATLIRCPDIDTYYVYNTRKLALSAANGLIELAFNHNSSKAQHDIQKALFYLYNQHVAPVTDAHAINQFHPALLEIRTLLQTAWESHELAQLPYFPPFEDMPMKVFVHGIKILWQTHRAYSHEIFTYMEHEASHDDFIRYICSDYAVSVRFYDLITLSLVGIPEVTRPEVADNFHDEMGSGNAAHTHVQLFRNLLVSLDLETSASSHTSLLGPKGLAGYNLLLKQVMHRKDYFRSIGTLAITELTDPIQNKKFLAGADRVGITNEHFLYYSAHVEIDAVHGDAWIDNVIAPMAELHPERRHEIIQGCWLRLNSAAEYWDELLGKMKDCDACRTNGCTNGTLPAQP